MTFSAITTYISFTMHDLQPTTLTWKHNMNEFYLAFDETWFPFLPLNTRDLKQLDKHLTTATPQVWSVIF
jgi:hypothetical protein